MITAIRSRAEARATPRRGDAGERETPERGQPDRPAEGRRVARADGAAGELLGGGGEAVEEDSRRP